MLTAYICQMAKTNSFPITQIYYISIILLMLSTVGTSWLRPIPYSLLVCFAFSTTIMSFSNGIFYYDVKLSKIFVIYVLITIIATIFSPYFRLSVILRSFMHTIVILGVIFLKDHSKVELFNRFVKTLTLILLITIPAWLLYLAGFRFFRSTYVDVGDGFHFLNDYTFFVISDIGERGDFLRFSSVFMEPGWIGTICCFTIFGMGLNFKKFPTWLCIFGLLLSMSLSAVVNLLICAILWIWQTSRHRMAWLCFSLFSLISVTMFALNYNKGNNMINQLIVQRLVFDEDLGIAGNNRTNDEFDRHFDNMITGSDKWFGIGYEIDQEFEETNDWYNHSSGIKKEIMVNGCIGTGLFLLLLIQLLIRYRSKRSFVFFVCFIMASFIRCLWRTDCYLILFIIILCTLCAEDINKNIGKVKTCLNH